VSESWSSASIQQVQDFDTRRRVWRAEGALSATAYAEQSGARSLAGWLVAANALGALIGGLWYGSRPSAADPARRRAVLVAALAVGYAPLALTPALSLMAVLAVLSGLALPPLLTCTFVLVDGLAPAGTVTEAFAWLVTAFLVGSSAGSGVAGVLLERADPGVAFAVGAGYAAVAVLLVLRRLAQPRT
jgi:MFS family permease